MCRIIRQARNQSPGVPPPSSESEIPVSPNHQTQSFCLQITDRTPALSTVAGAHSRSLFFSLSVLYPHPEKKRERVEKGVRGADWRKETVRKDTFPWDHCFGCRCEPLEGFSFGVCCLFSVGAKADGWLGTGTRRMWNSDFILLEAAWGDTAACCPESS